MNRENIFITGATGAIGTPVTAEMPGCQINRERITVPGLGVSRAALGKITTVVHLAAETRFNAPAADLWATNVEGTENVLEFARSCPRLERFVHVSTTCAVGDREGAIDEAAVLDRPGFVNGYEESKWEAERRVLESGLKYSILRVATVVGSACDGRISRRGAIHHCLSWLRQGLIPVLPGSDRSRLDLISSDRIVSAIQAAVSCPISELPSFAHISGGRRAPLLADLLASLATIFAETDPQWRRGIRTTPEIVGSGTFAAFQHAVSLSGDLLFGQINAATEQFLPALLHPKIYHTTAGDRLSQPDKDWQPLLRKVIAFNQHPRP